MNTYIQITLIEENINNWWRTQDFRTMFSTHLNLAFISLRPKPIFSFFLAINFNRTAIQKTVFGADIYNNKFVLCLRCSEWLIWVTSLKRAVRTNLSQFLHPHCSDSAYIEHRRSISLIASPHCFSAYPYLRLHNMLQQQVKCPLIPPSSPFHPLCVSQLRLFSSHSLRTIHSCQIRFK